MADPALLVERDQLLRLGDGALGVERQVGVDLGRDAAGDDLGHFRAEIDRDAVGDVADHGALPAPPDDRLLHQPRVGRHLRGFENEGGIGGRVGRPEGADRLHVAGVGDDGAHGAQLFELVGHGGIPRSGCLILNVGPRPLVFKRLWGSIGSG